MHTFSYHVFLFIGAYTTIEDVAFSADGKRLRTLLVEIARRTYSPGLPRCSQSASILLLHAGLFPPPLMLLLCCYYSPATVNLVDADG